MNADFSHTCEGCEHVVTELWAKDIISYISMAERMSAVESSAKSAHHRIDRLEGREVREDG